MEGLINKLGPVLPGPRPGNPVDEDIPYNTNVIDNEVVASRPGPGQTYDEPAKPNPNDFFENIGDGIGYLV